MLRKYIIPLILCAGLISYFSLWVTSEFLNSYLLKIKIQNEIASAFSANVQDLIRSSLKNGRFEEKTLKSQMEKLVKLPDIKTVLVKHPRGSVSVGKSIPEKDVPQMDEKGPEGISVSGKHLIYRQSLNPKRLFHGIRQNSSGSEELVPHLKGPWKIMLLIDAGAYFRDLAYQGRLLLVILILGITGAIFVFIMWSFVFTNIELRGKINENMKRRESVEDLSLVAAGLAHETKNPLGIIRGLAQQISEDRENPGNSRDMAREIMDEADITAARLGDFLNYARLRNPEPVALAASEIISRISDLISDDLRNKGVEVSLDLDDLKISADPEMLSQVLLNLLTNSLHSVDSGDSIEISLKRSSRSKAMIRVADTGTGIPPRLLPDIFKPYVSGRPGGYGIGLAIVKRIIDKSGWSINIESEQGRGTAITIENIGIC